MKKYFRAVLTLLLAALLLVSCGKKEDSGNQTGEADQTDPQPPAVQVPACPQLAVPQEGDTVVTIETSEGTIKAVLYPEYAPLAVKNFIDLANAEYYKDMLFHRVVAGFVIQTGDPTGTGRGGESASGAPFANETSPALHHFTGALGMANASANQNKSQFYIVAGSTVSGDLISQMQATTDGSFTDEVIEGYKTLGGQPGLDFRYTVFGQVYEGLDVVQQIAKVKVDEDDRPTRDMKLLSVTVGTYTAAEPDADAKTD